MREESKNWLGQAERDLRSALANLGIGQYHVTSLFAQQAAEKALKALLIEKKAEFIKTHDLVLLARKLSAPDNVITASKNLSPVYIETRYPDSGGSFKKYTKKEAEEDIELSQLILKWVKTQL